MMIMQIINNNNNNNNDNKNNSNNDSNSNVCKWDRFRIKLGVLIYYLV